MSVYQSCGLPRASGGSTTRAERLSLSLSSETGHQVFDRLPRVDETVLLDLHAMPGDRLLAPGSFENHRPLANATTPRRLELAYFDEPARSSFLNARTSGFESSSSRVPASPRRRSALSCSARRRSCAITKPSDGTQRPAMSRNSITLAGEAMSERMRARPNTRPAAKTASAFTSGSQQVRGDESRHEPRRYEGQRSPRPARSRARRRTPGPG